MFIQLSYTIYALGATLTLAIVTVITYTLLDANRHKWVYVFGHLLMQIEESVYEMILIMFVSKKRPAQLDHSTSTTQHNSPDTPHSHSVDMILADYL
jgi:uncharacterized membrane protein YcgQ (UPF0703/DUF1980 family)